MTRERYRQVKDLFGAALTHTPETRPAFLAEACAGDTALSKEVNQLLAAHELGRAVIDDPDVQR